MTATDTVNVDTDAARFLVETYPHAGRSATAVVHLPVPRTVLLDVVADVVADSRSWPFLTGEVIGGDDWTEWCEPAVDGTVALHVYVDGSGDERDVERAALRALLALAARTSYAHAFDVMPALSVSTLVWSEDRPLRLTYNGR